MNLVNGIIKLLLRRLWLLVLCVLILAAPAYYYGFHMKEKQYASSATIYVLKQAPSTSSNLYQELLAGLSLIKDYRLLLVSEGVMDELKARLNGEAWLQSVPNEELAAKFTIENKAESHIVTVTVKDPDPKRAALLANQTVQLFKDYARKITVDDSVTILDQAKPASSPDRSQAMLLVLASVPAGGVIWLLLILWLDKRKLSKLFAGSKTSA